MFSDIHKTALVCGGTVLTMHVHEVFLPAERSEAHLEIGTCMFLKHFRVFISLSIKGSFTRIEVCDMFSVSRL